MGIDKIIAHPHILRLVLLALRRPEPEPNSGASRDDVRQEDLAVCMRVSVVSRVLSPLISEGHAVSFDHRGRYRA